MHGNYQLSLPFCWFSGDSDEIYSTLSDSDAFSFPSSTYEEPSSSPFSSSTYSWSYPYPYPYPYAYTTSADISSATYSPCS